jgi:hypothetical protein
MRLAAVDLPATAMTDVYTVPALRRTVFTVSVCNRTSADRRLRLALCDGALLNADYIEFDTVIPPNGVLERSGLMLSAAQLLRAYADATGLSVVVYGIQEQV